MTTTLRGSSRQQHMVHTMAAEPNYSHRSSRPSSSHRSASVDSRSMTTASSFTDAAVLIEDQSHASLYDLYSTRRFLDELEVEDVDPNHNGYYTHNYDGQNNYIGRQVYDVSDQEDRMRHDIDYEHNHIIAQSKSSHSNHSSHRRNDPIGDYVDGSIIAKPSSHSSRNRSHSKHSHQSQPSHQSQQSQPTHHSHNETEYSNQSSHNPSLRKYQPSKTTKTTSRTSSPALTSYSQSGSSRASTTPAPIHTEELDVEEGEHWMDLKTFINSFVEPSSWRVLCEQCLGDNYSSRARQVAQFRFLESRNHSQATKVRPVSSGVTAPQKVHDPVDVSCIYAVTPHHPHDERGVVDLTYVGHDLSTELAVYDIVRLRRDQVVSFQLREPVQVAVLMRVPTYLRKRPTMYGSESYHSTRLSVPPSSAQVLTSQSQEPSTTGFFLCCDPRRKERQCDECGIVWYKRMPKCGRCQETRYCSLVCQRRAWSEHRKVCHKLCGSTLSSSSSSASASCSSSVTTCASREVYSRSFESKHKYGFESKHKYGDRYANCDDNATDAWLL